jgi:pimeloyl-ACP methyl ester carboxylesterase
LLSTALSASLRSPSSPADPTDVASSIRNIGFSDAGSRWRDRLGEIAAPTLVVHGVADPFFPIGNGEALAAEIPNARLVRLDQVGHRLPARAFTAVADDLLAHTAS